MALAAQCCDSGNPMHEPHLLRTNGGGHTRDTPLHPQTQGKIERCHQMLKNRILYKNCYQPGDLEQEIPDSVSQYSHL